MEDGQNKHQHKNVARAAYGAAAVRTRDLRDSQHTLWWCYHPCPYLKTIFVLFFCMMSCMCVLFGCVFLL